MSLPITFGNRWEAATLTVTGAATATVSGEVLTCTSVVGESAKAARHIRLAPGETLRAACLARRTSGADETSGSILITDGAARDRARVVSASWAEYIVSYTHPLTAGAAVFIAVECGVFTSDAGTVQFTKPRLEILNSQFGALRTIACGLVTLTAGVPTISGGFTSHGIRSMSYSATTKTLTITMDRSTGAAYSSPLFFTGMTKDGNGIKLNPKPGGYSAVAGTVDIQFSDNTGVAVDIAPLGTIYMWFKAEV